MGELLIPPVVNSVVRGPRQGEKGKGKVSFSEKNLLTGQMTVKEKRGEFLLSSEKIVRKLWGTQN